MRNDLLVGALLLTALLASPSAAQAPAQGEADPGVVPTRLIDRAEVRVSRVELQPGAIRRVHAHTDVPFHLWVPLTGALQITIGSDPPTPAAAGQAFFLTRNTPHGFKNVGTTPAAVLEVFVKDPGPSGIADVGEALALAFADAAMPTMNFRFPGGSPGGRAVPKEHP